MNCPNGYNCCLMPRLVDTEPTGSSLAAGRPVAANEATREEQRFTVRALEHANRNAAGSYLILALALVRRPLRATGPSTRRTLISYLHHPGPSSSTSRAQRERSALMCRCQVFRFEQARASPCRFRWRTQKKENERLGYRNIGRDTAHAWWRFFCLIGLHPSTSSRCLASLHTRTPSLRSLNRGNVLASFSFLFLFFLVGLERDRVQYIERRIDFSKEAAFRESPSRSLIFWFFVPIRLALRRSIGRYPT